ncbi:MAG TPA: hypothetical protein VFT49_01310 [Candidatus Saccharimonadales bacterium]|nr:hypothetical protein [Candidatus Saccharimonadales bacterium]
MSARKRAYLLSSKLVYQNRGKNARYCGKKSKPYYTYAMIVETAWSTVARHRLRSSFISLLVATALTLLSNYLDPSSDTCGASKYYPYLIISSLATIVLLASTLLLSIHKLASKIEIRRVRIEATFALTLFSLFVFGFVIIWVYLSVVRLCF